ncbi:MAG: amidohydrolase, partial [Acidobacteria bacterium]|nr:amidohydrolase [Acidobacteriota bacterium]
MKQRKLERDQRLDRRLPIPCQMVSNEETTPITQTPIERRLEQTILEDAARYAKRLGMDRRLFLRTSGGMACAFLALNKLFGDFYDVDEAEVYEPAATREKLPKGMFILDSQTHFCQDGMKTNLRGMS